MKRNREDPAPGGSVPQGRRPVQEGPVTGTWRAGLLDQPGPDALLLAALLAALVISRWLAYPSTIWDQDEANFALAVLHFDPLHNQPHAPFFPLWVVLGKIVRAALPGVPVQDCLRIVSVVASVWVFFPLRALWALVLPRAEATAAAALYLFLPAPWLLSGRAYSEPAATALFIAGVALWLRPVPTHRQVLGGGLLLASALLVRPQWALLAGPLGLWRVVRSDTLKNRALVVLPPILIGLATTAVLASVTGGITPLLEAVEQHRRYIGQAGTDFSWSYLDFAVNKALGGVVPGTIWSLLAIAGCAVLVRDKRTRQTSAVVAGLVLLPFLLLLLFAQNPTLPRYALPVLALSCGLVVAGLRAIVHGARWAHVGVAAAVLASAVAVLPTLPTYRKPSPVMAAFAAVENDPVIRSVAFDRRLVAIVTLQNMTGELRHPVVWDYQVELGMVTRSFRSGQAAVATGEVPTWVAQAVSVRRFRCVPELLRMVASPRFLDLTTVKGCALVRPAHPSITPDQLRPGAVIPAS